LYTCLNYNERKCFEIHKEAMQRENFYLFDGVFMKERASARARTNDNFLAAESLSAAASFSIFVFLIF